MTAAIYILTCITTLLCATFYCELSSRFERGFFCGVGLCFAGLTISNGFVIADLLLFPNIDLYTYRLGSTAVSMMFMLYGLIWESR